MMFQPFVLAGAVIMAFTVSWQLALCAIVSFPLVFLPVLFFPGATGTIYKQFAATILFSIGISTFNALTFSPMLAALLLYGLAATLFSRLD